MILRLRLRTCLRKAKFLTHEMSVSFWKTITEAAATNLITIDGPKGTAHPESPELLYPYNYGDIENTFAGGGEGMDVWFGSSNDKMLTGILCMFDRLKRDAEIKILIGCTHEDIETIRNFNDNMQTLFLPNSMVADDFSG